MQVTCESCNTVSEIMEPGPDGLFGRPTTVVGVNEEGNEYTAEGVVNVLAFKCPSCGTTNEIVSDPIEVAKPGEGG